MQAEMAAMKVGRAIEDERLMRTMRMLQDRAQLETRLQQASSEEQLAKLVLREVRSVLPLEAAQYFFNKVRAQGHGTHWEIVEMLGELPRNRSGRAIFGIDEGLSGWAIRDRKACFTTDPAARQKQNLYVAVADKAQSAIAVPILLEERVLGTLSVVASHKYAFMIDAPDLSIGRHLQYLGLDDVGVLEFIAQAAAAALSRLREADRVRLEREKNFQAFAEATEHSLRNWLTSFVGALTNEPWPESAYTRYINRFRRILAGYKDFILKTHVKTARVSVNDLLDDLRPFMVDQPV